MKKGDKVVCIYDGPHPYPDITKGEIYTIHNIYIVGKTHISLHIRGNRGYLQFWSPNLFILLKDQRKLKLEKIYEK